jgi:hypothetical protein
MFKGKFMWLMSAIWGGIGFFSLVKAEFLPKEYQDYTVVRALNFLSWRTWLLVLLVLLIGVILEGGHAAIHKRDQKIEDLETELRSITAPLLPNLHLETIVHGGTMGSGIFQRPKQSLFFRNIEKSNEAVGTVSVRAALRWKQGEEIRHVSPLAWWLGGIETAAAIDIGPGETAELIIATKNPSGNWDFEVKGNIGRTDAIWTAESIFEFEIRLINTKNGRVLNIPEPLTFRWDWRETEGHTSRPRIVQINPPDWTL